MFKCTSFKPHHRLQDLVQCYFVFETCTSANDNSFELVTPDGCTELNFSLNGPVVRKDSNSCASTQSFSYVVNRNSKPYLVSAGNTGRMIGIRFYPWGLSPFLEGKPPEIADMCIDPAEIFGTRIQSLEEKVHEARDPSDSFCSIDEFLLNRFDQPYRKDPLVADMMKRITSYGGKVDLPRLIGEYGVTDRRIQQRFKHCSGMSPKMFARLVRFRVALTRLHSGLWEERLTDLAHSSGYFDQSHFIHEFRSFAGVSPREYLRSKHAINRLIHAA